MTNDTKPDTVTFFRKRKSHHKIKETAAIASSNRDKAPKVAKNNFTLPHILLKNSLKKVHDEKRLLRVRKQGIKLQLTPGRKTLLVVRTKTFDKVPKAAVKALKALRLDGLNTAVFLRASKENIALIQTILPYVTFGEPSLKSIKDLIFKRGKTEIAGKPVALSSNLIVEKQLGDQGLICLEDIVHEISTIGENFEVASKFLLPFQFALDKKDSSTYQILRSAVDRTTPQEKNDALNNLISKLN